MFGFKIVPKNLIEIQSKRIKNYKQLVAIDEKIISGYKDLTASQKAYIVQLKTQITILEQHIKELENGTGSHGDRVGAATVDNCEADQESYQQEDRQAGQDEFGI